MAIMSFFFIRVMFFSYQKALLLNFCCLCLQKKLTCIFNTLIDQCKLSFIWLNIYSFITCFPKKNSIWKWFICCMSSSGVWTSVVSRFFVFCSCKRVVLEIQLFWYKNNLSFIDCDIHFNVWVLYINAAFYFNLSLTRNLF